MRAIRPATVRLAGLLLLCSPPALHAQDPAIAELQPLLQRLPAAALTGITVRVWRDSTLEPLSGTPDRLICIPDMPGDTAFRIACYPRTLEPFLALQRRLIPLQLGRAFQSRLCAAVRENGVPLPAVAYWVEGSGRRGPGGAPPDTLTVYHYVQVPYLAADSTGLPDSQLAPDQPWLHHAGTCDAHLMWREMVIRPAP